MTNNQIARAFNNFSFPPSMFDDIQRAHAKSFPPVNVLSSEDGSVTRIEMAVAGFDPSAITIEAEENKLTVSAARHGVEREGWNYETREIAHREFKRVWYKRSAFDVTSASFKNGILTIELRKSQENVKQIPILVETEN